ncbi:hypothetical protein WKK05_10575 [Nostoc sp. UHCC 0302]|uniref:hypothetical protein n=1 Tax=Nostoc sp. UHCC 0302 TaxID=3134896 RepID=UPI00311C8AF7
MDLFNSFDQFFRQLSELQKSIFVNWESMILNMQNINISNLPDDFEKAAKLQEELVKSSLDFQEQVSRFSIDTQRRMWDSYFKMLRKS